MNEPSPVLKRRNFFGLLGTGVSYGSLLVASPLVAAEVSSTARPVGEALRIGVVMPRSHLRPDLGASFCAGLSLACEDHPIAGRTIVPLLEEVGVGGNGWHSSISRLLSDHQPRVVVGMLDGRLAVEAGRLCEGKSVFLDCSAGAIIPDRTARGRPRCTLAHWQSAYCLGRWAAQQGKRASVISTFYDAGYDGLYAFQLGFTDGGGAVQHAVVIDVPQRQLTMEAALATVEAQSPDVVYAAIHDHQSGLFMNAWSQSTLGGQALLVANSLLVDYAQSHAHRTACDGVVVCSSYDPALALPENQTFRARYLARQGREPDAFAVLGHDAGQLIAGALQRVSDHADPATLNAAFLGAETIGPRGRIRIDPHSGSTQVSHYVSVCSWSQSGFQRRIIDRVEPIGDDDSRVVQLQQGLRSGWVNPYMSV